MGLKLIFLIVTPAESLLGLSRREWWWKDAEILMLRHQLAVAQRDRPRAHSRLAWPDRAWLALLAGTLPTKMVLTGGGHPIDSLERGVAAITRLAVDPGLEGVTGVFYDCEHQASPDPWAADPEAQERLWQLSEQLTA